MGQKTKRSILQSVAILAVSAIFGTAQADTFTLRIGSGHPLGPVTYVNTSHSFLVPEIERRVKAETQHEVKFVEAYGGTVAKLDETLEAVQKGILDMGHVCFCFEPSKAAVQNLNYFIPFSTPSAVTQLEITKKVYAEFPQLSEDFSTNYNETLLAITGYDNYNVGTKFPWEKFSELSGHTLGGAGPNLVWLEGSGTTVVQTGIPDYYTSLQTGVIEGNLLFPSSYFGLKLYEVAPNYKIVNLGAMMVNGLLINNKTAAKLPPEVLQIIKEVSLEYELVTAKALDADQAAGIEKLKAAGATITTLSEQERAEWAARLEDLPSKKAKEFTDMGYDGKGIFNAYFKAAKEAGYSFPVEYEIK
jgi:C4-dicarboxylate-binding protein DctP